MKKKLPVIIALIAIIAFSVWYGFTDKTHKLYDNNINTAQYNGLGVLPDGVTLEQSFKCEEDCINAFLIKGSPVGDVQNTVVNVKVIDPETEEVISQGSVPGAGIVQRKLTKIAVDPVKGYKGKELVISVSEQNAAPDRGISFFFQNEEGKASQFFVGGEAREGVFIMKTVTERFDLETCIVMFISIMFIWIFMWFLYRLFK